MSISTLNSEITRLTNDIVTLQNKLAREKKNESDKRVKIANIKKTITKNTSAGTLSSKMKQCEQLEKEITESVKKQAKLQKDIADKQKRLNDKSVSLLKEQQKEQKNQQSNQQKIIKSYEAKINSLQNTVDDLLAPVAASIKESVQTDDDTEYDVFISYASEDADFVDSLEKELHDFGIKVWRDKLSISWGDSIRKSIDRGLLKSKFAIVVLSKSYMGKYWTGYEFDGILNLETTTRKVFLPIWHNVTVYDVKAFSPSIAGRKAFETKSITAYGIAEKLKEILDENK